MDDKINLCMLKINFSVAEENKKKKKIMNVFYDLV